MISTLLLLPLILIGAQEPGTWAPTDFLVHEDGLDFEAFGSAVAVEGDLAAVGVPGQVQDGVFAAGAVHLYERQPDGSWSELQELSPLLGQTFGAFGSSVDLEGDWLAVGVPNRDKACPGLLNCRSGSVVLFHRVASGAWVAQPELVPLDNEWLDRFGSSVSLSGEWLAVGALTLSPRTGPPEAAMLA